MGAVTVQAVAAIGDVVVDKIKAARDTGPGFFSMRGEATLEQLNKAVSDAEGWRARGIAMAGSGQEPGGGWSGWVKAGQIKADGAAAILGEQPTVLPMLVETVADAPATTAKAIKKTTKAVAREVGETAGGVVSGAAGGFMGQAWGTVAVVAIVAAVAGFVWYKGGLKWIGGR